MIEKGRIPGVAVLDVVVVVGVFGVGLPSDFI